MSHIVTAPANAASNGAATVARSLFENSVDALTRHNDPLIDLTHEANLAYRLESLEK